MYEAENANIRVSWDSHFSWNEESKQKSGATNEKYIMSPSRWLGELVKQWAGLRLLGPSFA